MSSASQRQGAAATFLVAWGSALPFTATAQRHGKHQTLVFLLHLSVQRRVHLGVHQCLQQNVQRIHLYQILQFSILKNNTELFKQVIDAYISQCKNPE